MQTSLFSNNIRVRHVSDGTTDTFSCTIELIDESYLQVYFGETLQSTGWTYDESFQQVVFDEIPAEGTIITFLRYFPTIYTKSITEKGIINPEVLDNQMVEMVARIQTVEEKLSRTPTYPIDTEKSSEEVYDDFKRIENVATSAATKVLDTLEEIEDVRNEAVLGMGAAADAAKLNVSKYTSQMIDVIKDEGQESIDIARTWATGEQAEVEAIEAGQLSSRGFADLSLAFANAPEDVPVDESGMIAMEVFRGPKGDKGEPGKDGVDGKDGKDGKDGINGKDGTGLEIGDIGFSPLGIDETKNLRRYLNGQVILQSQFESFTNWVKERVALYPSVSTTEENWQATVTNTKLGQCGQFVIDDEAGTIRLPKVVNISGLQDLNLLGDIKAESLPNHTHQFQFPAYVGGGSGGTTDWRNGGPTTMSTLGVYNNPTYQDNAPVRQEAIQYPYFIQVATGAEESVDVTREIELNNPFFLGMSQYFESEPNNASWLISNGSFHNGATYVSFYEWLLKIYNGTEIVEGVSVKASTDTYDDYDYVINTADTTFRLPIYDGSESLTGGRIVESIFTSLTTTQQNYTCPANGFIYVGINFSQPGSLFVYKNGEEVAREGASSTANNGSTYFSVHKGDMISAKSDNPTHTTVSYFEYAQGNGSLYFYVGETIQDANVIAASQVLTDVANLKGYTVGIPDYTAGIDWSAAGTYTAPSSGWIMGFIRKSGSAANATLYVNDVLVARAGNDTGGNTYWYPISIFIEKWQIYKAEYSATSIANSIIKFFPCKGVN